jgi:TMEM175 potassium channel family protein
LTDAVFAFAMTLLVVNIELPEGFEPSTNRRRPGGHLRHDHSVFITFFVLIAFWFGHAKQTTEPEMASPGYAWAVLRRAN